MAIREYRDSDALISELGVSYNDGFDDALHQVKNLCPNLDVSTITINVPEQTSIQPAQSEDTDELFGDEAPVHDAPSDRTVAESNPTDGQVR